MLVFGCSGGGGGDDQENLPPSTDAGPEQAVDELTLVSLSDSGTDSDGTIISYAWSLGGGNNKQCRRSPCRLYSARRNGSLDLSADRDRQRRRVRQR